MDRILGETDRWAVCDLIRILEAQKLRMRVVRVSWRSPNRIRGWDFFAVFDWENHAFEVSLKYIGFKTRQNRAPKVAGPMNE